MRQLLEGLYENATDGPPFDVVVVDNDVNRSAEAVVAEAATACHFPVQYLVEPQQNISRARNKAIAHAGGRYVAFIDDDEVPSPTWLKELHGGIRRWKADAVFGPVIPRFEDNVPGWLISGGFFERTCPPSGTLLGWDQTRTSNTLVRRSVFQADAPFDERLGLSGGEDTALFHDLTERGCRLVSVSSAVVFEDVPGSRTRIRWLLSKSVSVGYRLGYHEISRRHRLLRPPYAAVSLAMALAYGLAGLVLFPFRRVSGFQLLQASMRYLGRTTFAAGFAFDFYAARD